MIQRLLIDRWRDSFRSLIICVMLLSNNSMPRLAPRITNNARKKILIRSVPQKCQVCQTILLSHHNIFCSQQKCHWNYQENEKNSWCDSRGLRDVVVLFCSLVSLSEKCKVCINHEINHFVSCINFVTIAEPINCHIGRCHGVEHKILKIGQGFGWEEVCFVHEPIIGTGVVGLRVALCHSINWFISLYFPPKVQDNNLLLL